MTIEELIAELTEKRDRAAVAAPPVAMAMADTFKDHLKGVTLRRSFAAPGQFGTPAPPGGPPAWRTGALATSVTSWPGMGGGMRASASSGPHTIYDWVQEYGATLHARRFPHMHWVNTGGEWWKKRVTLPARPYMQPALADVIADGSLQRNAVAAFEAVIGPW